MNILKQTQLIIQKMGYDSNTDTISLEADNFSLKDSVLQINSAESGDGVTAEEGISGIEVFRGPNVASATIYFSESEQCFKTNINDDNRVLGLSQNVQDIVNNLPSEPFDSQRYFTENFLGI